MTDKEVEKLIEVSWDLHVHVGPDILPRKYNVASLAEEEEDKIQGIVVKSHAFPTQPAVSAEEGRHRKLKLVGSITLNNFVGGINPDAVIASAVIHTGLPCIVWLPTIHAQNHYDKCKGNYEIPPDWIKDTNFITREKKEVTPIKIVDKKGRLVPEAMTVLTTVKKTGCIIATGHLSWEEAAILTEKALKKGIKVILTHATGRDIVMPLDVQKDLADKGAFVEYCYVFWRDRDNPEDYPPEETTNNIKEIGVEQCIITSDTGQLGNPSPSACLKEWVKLLGSHGLREDHFYQMLVENPKRILGY